jgi:DNA-binding transcriptional ArsR family regulator
MMADEIKDLSNIDRLIHEPSRLAIMAVLSACESADFTYLLNTTGLTKGNLSAHLSKLESAGYIKIVKRFKGKYPNTLCSCSSQGRRAFESYWKQYSALAQHLEQ